MSQIEGATKQRSPVVTWSVLAACSKKATFVKPYPPYLKSLCRYGGFVPSSWQNACNAAHDHHSPFAGGLRHLQSRYCACFWSIENGTGRPGNEISTVSATNKAQTLYPARSRFLHGRRKHRFVLIEHPRRTHGKKAPLPTSYPSRLLYFPLVRACARPRNFSLLNLPSS